MRQGLIRPSGVERTFADDEIIVSKTDPAGRLTYVNDVFTRVSAYTEDELLSKPHNVIRHPDMPRCVFHLLWETIRGGDELFAYVVNLAGDGAHYWVFAHITPTFSASGQITGYHSNRRTADRAAVARIVPVYQRLLAEERRHSRPADAIAASGALLADLVSAEAGSYDEYVWSLEPEKVSL
ncbi:PAS domain-containing protein [Planosporangium thailandense]|uniref:PAS domain-containing protein n=1 Tax=Planosporangium thailandense TaxID=765197 RepID=A0ABX0Y1P4_9ACTN|nr:PAS domain-containing protein [Planosporangium thailandense]NJC71958.1 PAS domain-containing protein [Planosporangium thailandense]